MEGFFSSSSIQLWKYIVTFMMSLFANLHTIKGCTVGFSKVLQRFTSFPCAVPFRCHCWLKRHLLSSWYLVYFKTETNTFHTHMQPKKATNLSDNPINPSWSPRYVLSQTGNNLLLLDTPCWLPQRVSLHIWPSRFLCQTPLLMEPQRDLCLPLLYQQPFMCHVLIECVNHYFTWTHCIRTMDSANSLQTLKINGKLTYI